jgi:hypothetical protein
VIWSDGRSDAAASSDAKRSSIGETPSVGSDSTTECGALVLSEPDHWRRIGAISIARVALVSAAMKIPRSPERLPYQ